MADELPRNLLSKSGQRLELESGQGTGSLMYHLHEYVLGHTSYSDQALLTPSKKPERRYVGPGFVFNNCFGLNPSPTLRQVPHLKQS